MTQTPDVVIRSAPASATAAAPAPVPGQTPEPTLDTTTSVEGESLVPADNGKDKDEEWTPVSVPAEEGRSEAPAAPTGEETAAVSEAAAAVIEAPPSTTLPVPTAETLPREPVKEKIIPGMALATRAVHADDHVSTHRAVAPALHVSTTFKYAREPEKLIQWENVDPSAPNDSHIYSRDSAPNTTRFEAVLSSLLGGPAVTYASGLAAFHALVVFLNPRRIAIGDGYHGCHGVIRLVAKLTGLRTLSLADADLAELQPGDVLHVETPLNPTGEARDLARYAAVARARGAYLTVDATFAPPPLQDPFALGADVVMHSGTKYFGGHSDLLCGVLAVAPARADEGWVRGLLGERLVLGSVMGSMEGWLGLRSLRTLELRVRQQSATAEKLVAWLAGEIASVPAADSASPSTNKSGSSTSVVAATVEQVLHASLQTEGLGPDGWLTKQMPNGFGPVFAILMRSPEGARRLPSKLSLFHHATSLGGVESLIEWRSMTDKSCSPNLLRVSVGVEAFEDLKADLEMGLSALLEESKGTTQD